jgi:sporulation protein YlmC with PRC-barrel domain
MDAQTTPQPGVMPGQTSGGAAAGMTAPSGLSAGTSQVVASSLIGEDVHAAAALNGESIGKVSDVAMTESGDVKAVIITVGSTLGAGGKDVAVPFEQLSWIDQNGESRLVVQMTPQQLESAPAFDKTSLTGPSVMDELKDTAGLGEEKPAATPGAAATPGTNAASQTSGQMAGAAPATGVNMISTETLLGTELHTAGGESAGKIADVIITPAGKAEAYVVDVGGVLGIGSKPVAVGASNVMIERDAEGTIQATASVSPQAIEDAPAYTLEAYRQSPENTVIR